MEALYKEVFSRGLSTQELIILRRLRKLYGESLVVEAIRLSVAVTSGSPIKYIAAVANNLHKESLETTYNSLHAETQKKLEELKKYGTSS